MLLVPDLSEFCTQGVIRRATHCCSCLLTMEVGVCFRSGARGWLLLSCASFISAYLAPRPLSTLQESLFSFKRKGNDQIRAWHSETVSNWNNLQSRKLKPRKKSNENYNRQVAPSGRKPRIVTRSASFLAGDEAEEESSPPGS